jgi:hypothetical protein
MQSTGSWKLHFLNKIYHPIKFQVHSFYTLGEMARTIKIKYWQTIKSQMSNNKVLVFLKTHATVMKTGLNTVCY